MRQHFVLDLDQLERRLGDRFRGRGDRGHRMAVVERLLARHRVAGHVAVGATGLDLREVVAADHRLDAGKLLRGRNVDRLDDCVRVRAAQDFPDQHAGQIHVGAELRAPGHLVEAVVLDRRASDDLELLVGIETALFKDGMGLCHDQRSSHFFCRRLHRADDLVVAGAPAEVAGQPVADFGFGRIGIALEQRACGDQDAGRTDAALRAVELKELLLQRMQLVALGHALDGVDLGAVGLDREHEARADHGAVDHHGAGAAVAGGAAFLGAGKHQLVAQHIEQRLLRLAQVLVVVAVDGRRYVILLRHQFFLATSSARKRRALREHARDLDPVFLGAALVVDRTAGGARRCGELVERGGVDLGADQRVGAFLREQHGRRHRAERDPRRDAGAAIVEREVHADADHRDVHLGARGEALVGVAGVRRRAGRKKETMISSLASEVLPGPVGICSTGTSRVPLPPMMRAIAPAAISGGTLSAAGEPLQRLPPIEARPRTWIEPISLTPSSTPGHALASAVVPHDLHARHRGADAEAAVLGRDLSQLGDLLDVDQERGLDQVGFHLNDDVGAAGKDFRRPGGARQQRDGCLERFRRFISHIHACHSPYEFLAATRRPSNLLVFCLGWCGLGRSFYRTVWDKSNPGCASLLCNHAC